MLKLVLSLPKLMDGCQPTQSLWKQTISLCHLQMNFNEKEIVIANALKVQ